MNIRKIKIAYRQLIGAGSGDAFEQKVLDDSYEEFKMQVQAYNDGGRLTTLADILAHNPKASSLHYKVGFAIGLYINELGKQIPGLYDNRGKPVLFSSFEFELIGSDITNKLAHKVAVTYMNDKLVLLDSFGDHLLLAHAGEQADLLSQETFTLRMQPNLSIISLQELN